MERPLMISWKKKMVVYIKKAICVSRNLQFFKLQIDKIAKVRNLSSPMRQTTKYSVNIGKISIFNGNHIWKILKEIKELQKLQYCKKVGGKKNTSQKLNTKAFTCVTKWGNTDPIDWPAFLSAVIRVIAKYGWLAKSLTICQKKYSAYIVKKESD